MMINLNSIDLEKYILDSGLELIWLEIIKIYLNDDNFKNYLNEITINFNHKSHCLNLKFNKSKSIYQIYSELWSEECDDDDDDNGSGLLIFYKSFKFDRYLGLSQLRNKNPEDLSIINHSIDLCDHIKINNVVSDL